MKPSSSPKPMKAGNLQKKAAAIVSAKPGKAKKKTSFIQTDDGKMARSESSKQMFG